MIMNVFLQCPIGEISILTDSPCKSAFYFSSGNILISSVFTGTTILVILLVNPFFIFYFIPSVFCISYTLLNKFD